MNDKFFSLSEERQNKILNAGYYQFAHNSYKKTSMSMIAEEAQISKSLLFHYFHNKKEFYLYLYKRTLELIDEKIIKIDVDSDKDIIEIVSSFLLNKWNILKEHKYIFSFIYRVYYETDETLLKDLKEIRSSKMINSFMDIINKSNNDKMRYKEDFLQLVNIIIYTAEGFAYVNKELLINEPQKAVNEFMKLVNTLKKNFYKE